MMKMKCGRKFRWIGKGPKGDRGPREGRGRGRVEIRRVGERKRQRGREEGGW